MATTEAQKRANQKQYEKRRQVEMAWIMERLGKVKICSKCGYEGDIMILPSKKTDFNRFKSNLKILEAGALKMPIVVSENEPYLGMPVMYVGIPLL